MTKKKVLCVSEASYLNSGYSNYAKELLTRLHNSNKYEIAEFASYGNMSDARVKNIPWKYYANAPEQYEKELIKIYKAKTTHEFGEWRFDKVLLDFRPDVVLAYRDPWMDSYQKNSHLRPYFSWLIMPTADSAGLEDEWINTYMDAEGVLTYTEWAKEILDIESGNQIRTLGAAPCGVNYDLFKAPEDKKAHKEKYGISGDSIIVGTVMRNQKRKLFPDLIQAFANSLDRLPDHISKNMYLYLHTSYPERQCWNLPKLIKEAGIGTKTIVSYICRLCKRTSCMIFQDARARCPHCNNVACVTPNVGFGHSTEQLVEVFQLFDLYVQYAITEGFGIPQIEAAACEVPVASVDYSAMGDIVRRLEGYPIKVQRMFREFESHSYRAYPDNDHLTDIICKFAQLPKDYIDKRGKKTRKLCKEYFNWDRVAKIWEDAIDSLPKARRNWNDPPQIFSPATSLPDNVTNSGLVEYLFTNVYHNPNEIYALNGLSLLRDMNFGVSMTNKGIEPLDKKKILERLIGKTNGRNLTEQARCGMIQLQEDNFIKFANTRNIKQ